MRPEREAYDSDGWLVKNHVDSGVVRVENTHPFLSCALRQRFRRPPRLTAQGGERLDKRRKTEPDRVELCSNQSSDAVCRRKERDALSPAGRAKR